MNRTVVRSSLCLAVAIALLVPAVYVVAGGGVPLIVTIDNAGGLKGDNKKQDYPYLSPYTYYTDYTDGDPGTITVLRVQLMSNNKNLALDTRGAGRYLRVDFGTLHDPDYTKCLTSGLSIPELKRIGLTTFLDETSSVFETEALFQVLLSQPFPSLTEPPMSVSGVAKLWFTTMDGSDWRVDWPEVKVMPKAPVVLGDRVHRVWEVTATTYAGLSKLSGKRTKPGSIGTEGCYSIPIFLIATEM